MKILVTGGSGFIGSHVVDRLLADGNEVIAYDNLSTGQEPFLAAAKLSPKFRLVVADLLDSTTLADAIAGCQRVYHMAANADVRFGTEHPHKDIEQNTIATFHLLEAMRAKGLREIVFASTGSVYGDTCVVPTPEDAPFPIQTSLYGASKVACEALIQAYCEGFGFRAWIFRFVSILGERYSHGHVFDFYQQLRQDPARLKVLGDGKQRKSYLYVSDCVDAMSKAVERSKEKVNIYNLGTNDYCSVDDSIGWICRELRVQPAIAYSGGSRGWIGDNPFIWLDCSNIRALGWQPTVSIQEAVARTTRYLNNNGWLLYARRSGTFTVDPELLHARKH